MSPPPATRPPSRPGPLADLRPAATALFAVTAVASALAALAGLSVSSWWTDELFTLFVIDHRGGTAEVMRRALTDTQPPLYYLLLHAWAQEAGAGEAALRGLSAVMAVAAAGLFWWSVRRLFSFAARTWAAAVAVSSPFWFFQSQNIRNYSLCLLLAAAMLPLALRLRREVRAGRAPWATWAALTAVGLLDAATHFYGLLGFGALLLALIAGVPSWRFRAALAAPGLAALAGEAAYVHVLVGHTHENFQHLWFRRDPAHLLGVLYDVWKSAVGGTARAAVLLVAAGWAASALLQRRRGAVPSPDPVDGERSWLVAACVFIPAALYAGGVVVSLLFAPSLSDRNVLTAAPAIWVLLAALYDAALRRLDPAAGGAVALAAAALVAFHAVAIARGRALPRNEPWRETTRYVAALPACREGPLDAVQPDRFGPDTPFYRDLARRDFFGRDLGARRAQVQVHLRAALTDPRVDPELARRLALRSRDPAACPVLAWAVHDVTTAEAEALRDGIAALPGAAAANVRLRTFPQAHLQSDSWRLRPAGYVIERVAPPPDTAPWRR